MTLTTVIYRVYFIRHGIVYSTVTAIRTLCKRIYIDLAFCCHFGLQQNLTYLSCGTTVTAYSMRLLVWGFIVDSVAVLCSREILQFYSHMEDLCYITGAKSQKTTSAI